MFERLDFRESAARFHARCIPDDPIAQIWVNHVAGPALVLGSTQRDPSMIDVDECARRGIDIVRRRSGGGAVFLAPSEVTWFDVIIPSGVPGWAQDVHAPMVWLGERFAAACHAAGVTQALTVHGNSMVRTEWSTLVCFDGIGPGEVLLDGRKLLGISQRRTRAALRLQCCWYHKVDSAALIGLLPALEGTDPAALTPIATLPMQISVDILHYLCSS
jgi:lipoate-protein ligase A